MAPETLTDADFQTATSPETPALTDADFQAAGTRPTVSQPPAPQATTYLEDKDMVVGHPMDMSHDQVNDAIQTGVYGRPRTDFHRNASPVEGAVYDAFKNSLFGTPAAIAEDVHPEDVKPFVLENLKAAVRGFENGAVGLAGITKMLAENSVEDPKLLENPQDLATKAAAGLVKISDKAIAFMKQRQESGVEAPDPEIFRGSFVSNPSFTRLAANVTQSIPSLVAATLLTYETGDPLIGAGALGLVSGGEQYEASREFGQTPEQAAAPAMASTIGNTLLMSLPLGKALEGFGGELPARMAKGAIEFTGVTAVMTPFNNIVAKLGGDKARGLFDGMTESLLAAAVSGGTLGGFSPGRGAEIDGLVQEAHKAGVPARDIDGARAEIAKQMAENPDVVLGAIKNEKVYNDIKGQLSSIQKPETMTDAQWKQNIDDGAKVWAEKVTAEAAKRGLPVDEVYQGMRPEIAGWIPGLSSPSDLLQQGQEPTGQNQVYPEGTYAGNERSLRNLFPVSVSFDTSIAGEPAFREVTQKAFDVVNKYAQARGVTPDVGFVKSLKGEFHDALHEAGTAMREKNISKLEEIKAKYPDLENDWQILKDKLWTDKAGHSYFDRYVKPDYGVDTLSEPSEESRPGFRPMEGLSADQRSAETKLWTILNQPDAAEKYAAIPETKGGKVLNVDYARQLSPDYVRDQESTTHHTLSTQRPASAWINRRYHEMLKEPAKGPVVFLAGGGGSGKSTAEGSYLKPVMDNADIVFDGVMSDAGTAKQRIEAAIESGRAVEIVYVHRPLMDAAEGVIQRFSTTGRHVPADVITAHHVKAQATFLELAKEYADDPDVNLEVFDNSGKAPKRISVEELGKKAYTKGGKSVDEAIADLLPGVKEKLSHVERKVKEISDQRRNAGQGQEASQGTEQGDPQSADRSSEDRTAAGGLTPPPGEPPPGGSLTPEVPPNKYVINRPFDLSIGEGDKSTTKDIRERFAGLKNEQIVRGNQLADELKKQFGNYDVNRAAVWYGEANGDLNKIADALHNPNYVDEEKYLKIALQLSPEAADAIRKGSQYYEESGRVSQEIGTIGNVRENYQNRIYAPDKPQDFVKTEMKSGIKQTTRHAKQRVYDTLFDAYENGKRLMPDIGYSDLLAIHNEEMARVNTSRKMAEAMADAGLGAWKKEQPDGWEQVGNLQKRVPLKDKDGNALIGDDGNQVFSQSKFYAPKGIAKGLEALTDPDYIKKIDSLGTAAKYQGLVKTINLGLFSYFHHWNFIKSTLANGGFKSLIGLIHADKAFGTDAFKYTEQDMALHLGTSPIAEDNLDVLRSLTKKNDDFFSKITNLPIVKQALDRTETNANTLFRKIGRFLKVTEYGRTVSNWVADHPDATNAEVSAAKKGFAKQANDAYGGQSWMAMGMTKSNLSLLRLAMLAPDWFTSNAGMIKSAFFDFKTTRGSASRKYLIVGMAGGVVLTEGLNKMTTGHFTDENKPGHKLEWEIAPDVYVSLFPAPVAEAIKYGSMAQESGPIAGTGRYMQGKLGPLYRTITGLLTRTTYSGKSINNTYDALKFVLSSASPAPITLGSLADYEQTENKKTLAGRIAVATGLGRYSRSKSNTSRMRM